MGILALQLWERSGPRFWQSEDVCVTRLPLEVSAGAHEPACFLLPWELCIKAPIARIYFIINKADVFLYTH